MKTRTRRPAGRRPNLSRLRGARRADLPEFVEPQLAALVARPPEGDGWLHEIKLDGYRMLARLEGGRARLLTRKRNDWTRKYPAAAAGVEALAARSALIDGEIVVLDERGRSDFQALQNAGPDDARLRFFAFDLLYLDGYDLRGCALRERKRLLRELTAQTAVAFAEHIEGSGGTVFDEACRLGLEGVVSKRADSVYESRRGETWLKSKCFFRQEFVIVGWTEPEGGRRHLGGLLLGLRGEKGALTWVGRCGSGFDEAKLAELAERLRALETERPPVLNPPRDPDARWTRPKLVAEVRFSGWTEAGMIRGTAVFEGLREDLSEDAVVHGVKVTALKDPVLPGVSKAELLYHYDRVAERLLPFVAGRPLMTVRADGLIHKHATAQRPGAVKSVMVWERKHDRTVPYIMIEDKAGLTALVELGAVELHPWSATARRLEQPDALIFDLDPGEGVSWRRVVDAARLLKQRLEARGLAAFAKTSGGKGLHVYVPLLPEKGWPEARAWARALAQELAAEDPEGFTAVASKAERPGRIFVDYLRNGRGATAVAPYSVRARAGAPVSAPVSWSDLDALKGGADFTIRDVFDGPDPWAAFDASRRRLP